MVSTLALVLSVILVALNQAHGQQTICDLLMPCQNGGTCVPTGLTYECHCPQGYVNRKCDLALTNSLCNVVKCNGYCTASYYQFSEFICMPPGRLTANSYSYTSAYNTDISRNCPVPSPCQNGGQCYTYWANAQTQLYGCICEKGFAGTNCEKQYSFGLQPMSIQAWPQQIYTTSYQSFEALNQNFILLNSEIKADMVINKVEYAVTRAGTFKLSFFKPPNCGSDGQVSCADMFYSEYVQKGNTFQYSYLISNALANAVSIYDSGALSGSWNTFYTSTYSNLWIPVVKGTLIILTQVDAFVTGTPLSTAQYSDLILNNATNNQYSFQSIQYSPLNWAFTLLVSDTTKSTSSWSSSNSYCANSLCQNGATCMQYGYTYSCLCPSYASGQYCENSSQTTARPALSSGNNNNNNNNNTVSNGNNNNSNGNNNGNNGNSDPCSSNPCSAQQTCETMYDSASQRYLYTCQSKGSNNNSDGGFAHYLNFFFSIFDINNFH